MAREFRGKIPRVPIDADTSKADQKIDRLFQRVKNLGDIKIDANVSQAQRRLETLVKRTNSQLSSSLLNTMIKDFKTVLGAMKTEFDSLGDVSDIYKNLEKTCNMVEDRFSNLTISVDKKKISGLTEILNTVTELQSISDFSFGDVVSKQAVKNTDTILSNIKEAKKDINSIVGKIDYIQKTLSKKTNNTFSTEKLQQYKDKLHELRGMLQGFYSIDDDLIQNALVNAAAKINDALGQIDIQMPKVKGSKDVLSTGETLKELGAVEKKAKATQEVVNRISKNSSIAAVKSMEGLSHEAVNVASVLAEMYDKGITDSERFITLQYKLKKIFDAMGKSYGGLKTSGAQSANELFDFVLDGIEQRTGVNLFADTKLGPMMENLFGDSDFSLFNKSLSKLGMKHVAELLLSWGKTGDWVEIQRQVTSEIEATGAAQEHVISGIQETTDAIKKEKDEMRELADIFKSTEEIMSQSKTRYLGKDWRSEIYNTKNSEDAAKVLSEIDDQINLIASDAHKAKLEYDMLNTAILSYTGRNINSKSEFGKAIKDAWVRDEKEAAAKLFETYQKRFPDGKFDPNKTFGDEWVINYAQNLEAANRSLSLWRNGIKAAAEEYGKFLAYHALTEEYNPSAGTMGFREMAANHLFELQSKETSELNAAEKAVKLLEQAQSRFVTDDVVKAQENLNAAIDEYNAKLDESNRLREEFQRLQDLDTFENEPWFNQYETPAKKIMEVARQVGAAEDAVNDYTVALKEAVRVYRELGGDMKLPFTDEGLLKEIDIPVKIVPVVEKPKYYEIDEKAARTSKQMRSFDDYKEGSATASYRAAVDELAKVVEEKKEQFSDKADKLDQLLDRYAKNLATYINRDNQIGAQYPSVMISGAGNYNIKKHNKQMASWGKNYQYYEDSVLALENKIRSFGGSGTTTIRGDEENALERLESKIEYMKYWHQVMVEANKYYKKNKTMDGFLGAEPDEIERIKKDLEDIQRVGMYDTPYPSYALTNDNQNIKRIEGRIAELKRLKAEGGSSDALSEANDIYKLWVDKEDMRIRISFEIGKPDQEIIDMLRGKAFKWSRTNNAWQRQLTDNAIYATKQLQKYFHEFYKIEEQTQSQIDNKAAQEKMAETIKLVGELQTKYGTEKFGEIFGDIGAIDVSNAETVYDSLIAKEEEYLGQVRERQNALEKLTMAMNVHFQKYIEVEEFTKKYSELAEQVIGGQIGFDDAYRQLQELSEVLSEAVQKKAELFKAPKNNYEKLFNTLVNGDNAFETKSKGEVSGFSWADRETIAEALVNGLQQGLKEINIVLNNGKTTLAFAGGVDAASQILDKLGFKAIESEITKFIGKAFKSGSRVVYGSSDSGHYVSDSYQVYRLSRPLNEQEYGAFEDFASIDFSHFIDAAQKATQILPANVREAKSAPTGKRKTGDPVYIFKTEDGQYLTVRKSWFDNISTVSSVVKYDPNAFMGNQYKGVITGFGQDGSVVSGIYPMINPQAQQMFNSGMPVKKNFSEVNNKVLDIAGIGEIPKVAKEMSEITEAATKTIGSRLIELEKITNKSLIHVLEHYDELNGGIKADVNSILQSIGLMNDKLEFTFDLAQGGNSRAIIGDKFVILQKSIETSSEFTDELISKLNQAQEAGVNVAAILERIPSSLDSEDNGRIKGYEIQQRAIGDVLHLEPRVSDLNKALEENQIVLSASRNQLIKFIQDWLKLRDIGLQVDPSKASNFLYSADSGFSFIDLTLQTAMDKAKNIESIFTEVVAVLANTKGLFGAGWSKDDSLKLSSGQIITQVADVFEKIGIASRDELNNWIADRYDSIVAIPVQPEIVSGAVRADETKELTEENKKLESSYVGLAEAVEKYVESSQKLWDAYNNNKDFVQFAEERNAAVEQIASLFPDENISGMSATLTSDGYKMQLQDAHMSQMFAAKGAEETLRVIEANLTKAKAEQARLAQEAASATEAQAEAERQAAESARKTADEKERQSQEAERATKPQIVDSSQTNVLDNLGDSAEEAAESMAIAKDKFDDILNVISSAAHKVHFNPFEELTKTDDVLDGFQNIIDSNLGDDTYKYVGTTIQGSKGVVHLKNAFGSTIDAVYRLKEGILELDKDASRFNDKWVNFDASAAFKKASADIRNLKADLGTIKYDGIGELEKLANNIASPDGVEAFVTALKTAKTEVAALKKEYAKGTNSLNDFSKASSVMRNAETHIQRMRLELEKLGNVKGVSDAEAALTRMTTAAENFKKATSESGQRDAWNNYNEARIDYDAQYKYAQTAQKTAKAQENQAGSVKSQYQSILDLINKINTANERMTKFQSMDDGTGLLGNQIQGEIEKRAEAIEKLESVLSNLKIGTVLGETRYTLPDDVKSIGTDYSQIAAFINDAGVQASVTKTEIDKLVDSLVKAGDIDLSMMSEALGNESLKQHIKQVAYENKYFSDITATQENTSLKADDIQKLGNAGDTAKEKLEGLAQTIAKNSEGAVALTKNFSIGADGIAKLDFSIFDTSTGSIRNFTVALGTATGQMGVFETTTDKSVQNVQSALNQIEKSQSSLASFGFGDIGLNDTSAPAQVTNVLRKIEELRVALEAKDETLITQCTKDLAVLTKNFEKAGNQAYKMRSAIENGTAYEDNAIDPNGNIYSQLTRRAQEYAAAQGNVTLEVGSFDKTTNTLNASLVHTNGTVEQLKFTMYGLGGEVARQQTGVGKLTTSWDKFKASIGKAGKQLMTAFVGYNVFYKAISEVRKGIGYVKEIDLALTELKKVTDETEESYKQFLNTAADTAGKIGSTVSDFTEATANFARLGYTMEESAKMAETAIVYKNVADGLDTVEEATDSIISTMKAFGIESSDTMSIVDRFNEVGKYVAQAI